MSELEERIMEILNEIEAGNYRVSVVNNRMGAIQILLLTQDNRIIRHTLDDIKKAVNVLELKGTLIKIPTNVLEEFARRCNSSNKKLEEPFTDEQIFMYSFIMKA